MCVVRTPPILGLAEGSSRGDNLGETRTQSRSQLSPTDGGPSEERFVTLVHLSSHQRPQVLICKHRHTSKFSTLLLKIDEELHEEHVKPLPAPTRAAVGRGGLQGHMPILRPHSTCLKRWRPRRTGADVPRAAVAGTIGFTCHVPAPVPFCLMELPHQGQ